MLQRENVCLPLLVKLAFFLFHQALCLWYSRGMENSQPKRRHVLRNVILGVVALPVLFIIYVVGSILLSPVFQHFEKARIEKLDEQLHVISFSPLNMGRLIPPANLFLLIWFGLNSWTLKSVRLRV